jgi:hypothetical protein
MNLKGKTMTKKHFNELAKICKDLRPAHEPECANTAWWMWGNFVDELTRFCASQNPAFDSDRFKRACKEEK